MVTAPFRKHLANGLTEKLTAAAPEKKLLFEQRNRLDGMELKEVPQ